MRFSSVLATLLLAAAPRSATAADVEIFGGLGIWNPRFDTLYDASYTPSRVVGIGQLFEEPDPRSQARQLLALRGATGPGIGLGVNVFPTPVLGIQILFDRARLDVSGESPPHAVSLTYDTIAFPSSERVVRTIDYTFDPPSTEGTLDETTLSFNLAARIGGGRRLSGVVSGGLSYFRSRIEAEPLAAHAAWLGGHAVVFSELYEMSYRTDPAGSFGANLGGQLDLSLGRSFAVFVDGRFFLASEAEVPVQLDELLSDNVVTVPLSRIEGLLDLRPMAFEPSYARVLFGLKWKLSGP